MKRTSEWPKPGELVVARVTEIKPYGAYVTLEEYRGEKGLIPISEIASGWIRRIRDFVRERQILVLKVLRVDPRTKSIDLSLKRVTVIERKKKMLQWKRERKAMSIIILALKKLSLEKELSLELKEKALKYYENLYDALKEAVKENESVLIEIGFPKNLAKTVAEIAKSRIKIPEVKIKAIFSLTCFKPNGISIIRNTLLKAKKSLEKVEGIKINMYGLGAPRYAIKIIGKDPKIVKKAFKSISEKVSKRISKFGGTCEISRLK